MDTEITIAVTGTATLRHGAETVLLDAEAVQALAEAWEALNASQRAQVKRGGRLMVVKRGGR